jgi:hypothetical protein
MNFKLFLPQQEEGKLCCCTYLSCMGVVDLSRIQMYTNYGRLCCCAHISCIVTHISCIVKVSCKCVQEFSVMSYTLLLSLIEYKTLVLRKDYTAANEILPQIPQARPYPSLLYLPHRCIVAYLLWASS